MTVLNGSGGARYGESFRRYMPIALVVAVGTMLAALAYWVNFNHFQHERAVQRFEAHALPQVTMIERTADRFLEVVQSIGAFYAATAVVHRDEFRAFVEPSLRRYPGIQALEWIPRVPDSERAAYEARAHESGHTDFRITERNADKQMVVAARRAEYFPVYFVEPVEGNQKALGFDLASNAARLAALDQARDTGQAVATQRITLVQESGRQFGSLVFFPIYTGGIVPETVAERRSKLKGFALGVFRIRDMIEAALRDVESGSLAKVFVLDESAPADARLLYASRAADAGADAVADSLQETGVDDEFRYTATYHIAGRKWSIVLTATAEAMPRFLDPVSAGIALVVLLLTAILTTYLWSARNRTDEIERLVADRSRELTTANEALQTEFDERKRIQQHLVQAQKMDAIGQLTGGIAHDFNNLLMIIDGYTRRAISEKSDGVAVTQALSKVVAATDRAANLTRQLLTFSRRQIMETKVFNVPTALTEIESMLRHSVGERIDLRFEFDNDGNCIESDRNELSQAVVNLAINARDAMPDGGTIVIGSRTVDLDGASTVGNGEVDPGRYVEIYVKDEGTGIDDEVLQHIFEPFFTTRDQGAGTGLGLAMVYGFAQQSKGVATVSSTLGEGTTVRLYLPVSESAPSEEVPNTAFVKARGQGETILLVEDDNALLDLTRSILQDLGYAVLTASNGIEALEVDEDCERTIDLMLSDVVMPVMGGYDLVRAMRGSRPAMKIVLMSGYPGRAGSVAEKVPANVRLLRKPLKAEKLARCIRAELDQAAA